jgi:hypothetical protein
VANLAEDTWSVNYDQGYDGSPDHRLLITLPLVRTSLGTGEVRLPWVRRHALRHCSMFAFVSASVYS